MLIKLGQNFSVMSVLWACSGICIILYYLQPTNSVKGDLFKSIFSGLRENPVF